MVKGILDCATETYVPFDPTPPALTLSSGAAPAEGLRTVSVCIRDDAGNDALAVDTILLDTHDPTGSVSITRSRTSWRSPTAG